MRAVHLTPLEQDILRRSSDLEVTRRRIRMLYVFSPMTPIALFLLGWMTQSWVWVAAYGAVYAVLTALEKVAYGKAVLAYKSLIQKLRSGPDTPDDPTSAHGG